MSDVVSVIGTVFSGYTRIKDTNVSTLPSSIISSMWAGLLHRNSLKKHKQLLKAILKVMLFTSISPLKKGWAHLSHLCSRRFPKQTDAPATVDQQLPNCLQKDKNPVESQLQMNCLWPNSAYLRPGFVFRDYLSTQAPQNPYLFPWVLHLSTHCVYYCAKQGLLTLSWRRQGWILWGEKGPSSVQFQLNVLAVPTLPVCKCFGFSKLFYWDEKCILHWDWGEKNKTNKKDKENRGGTVTGRSFASSKYVQN